MTKKIDKTMIDLDGIDIMIELTRFCNMSCPHCIRGDAQRKRIKKEYIYQFLSNFEYINTLVFTGGEPALALDLMQYALDVCRQLNINVGNIWLATNGTVTSKKFFNLLADWLEYCNDNEISGLRVSIDKYHDSIDTEYIFKDFVESLEWEHGLNGDNFYLDLTGAPNDSDRLIGDGRAMEIF